MKRRILRHKFALWMVVALALASCSQEEFADSGQGTLLPYGKYPLELTAAIGEAVATPATRGTVHGTWPDGYYYSYLQIASSIEYPEENKIDWMSYMVSTVRTYQIYADGTMVIDRYYTRDPIYWRRSDEIIYIYAYSWSRTPDERNTSDPHEVYEDQSEEDKLNDSDYLFAYEALTFDGDHTLHFRHLTSKVTINLRPSEYLSAQAPEDVEVKLTGKDGGNWYIKGNFIGRNPDEIALFEAEGLEQSEIIPYRNPNPAEGMYATYEAVVIPQKITGTGKTIEIKVGETTYSYEVECSKGQYTSGEEWIYNITVGAKGLDVTVGEGNIGWDKGDTGNGNVAQP
ncbi:fimbrillin family protein [Phocaeicola dorei]|uniref:fimbrillin family protein n=1 Tax=Phocaeicola dorei TaxID=357276 RepID=UPI001873468C|nr:fimbrillin family protein [Phocaeicola dorei]MBE5080253.1 fimbrillin family protein [Phocaeicola dorei]